MRNKKMPDQYFLGDRLLGLISYYYLFLPILAGHIWVFEAQQNIDKKITKKIMQKNNFGFSKKQ